MRIEQYYWERDNGWSDTVLNSNLKNPQLVLYFGAPESLHNDDHYFELRSRFPAANLIGCTSAGEILGEEVYDDSIVVTAIEFEKTNLFVSSVKIDTMENSYEYGIKLANTFDRRGLKGILLLSDGTKVNGSELVRGLVTKLGVSIPITGGLAGDGARFKTTLVGCNEPPESGNITAIGFYGSAISIGHGSVGGWDPFGPERQITKSEGNILYELDGRPALELYKKYLGEEAQNLPGSALLFPLKVHSGNRRDSDVVRTILSISEEDQSMTFAGDIPQGVTAQLMKANFERLIDGASDAASIANKQIHSGDKLAILISCVGRKMILGQRTADEVEAVNNILGTDTFQIGFYSYGEISPHISSGSCQLHNQTMTITLLSEN
jgi:hypothetical protein